MKRKKQLLLSAFLLLLTVFNGWVASAVSVADAQCQTQMKSVCCVQGKMAQCGSDQAAIAKVTNTCACQVSCSSSCVQCLQVLPVISHSYFLSVPAPSVTAASYTILYAFDSIEFLFRPPRLTA